MSTTRLPDLLTQPKYTVKFHSHYYSRKETYYIHSLLSVKTLEKKITELKINHTEVSRQHNSLKKDNALHYVLSGRFSYTLPRTNSRLLFYDSSQKPMDSTSIIADCTKPNDYNNQQNQELHLIVKALILPYDDSKNHFFKELMLSKDYQGNTPLHIVFQKPNASMKEINILLNRIQQLNLEEKKAIACALNKKNENFLACVLQQWYAKKITTCIKYFGIEGMHEAVFKQDLNGYTGFHYACMSSWGNAAKKIKLLAALDEKKIAAIKAISSVTIQRSQNALHLACQHDKSDEAKLIQTIKNIFIPEKEDKKEHWINLIKKQDTEGYTALHYACESGNTKSVKCLLQDLPPELKSHLIHNMCTKKGETVLDIACRAGSRATLELLTACFTLKDINDYHAKHLLKKQLSLISKNKNIRKGEMELKNLITLKTSPLINVYQYLVMRSKQSGFLHPVQDYEKRLQHFVSSLRVILNGSEEDLLPEFENTFSAGRSKNYQTHAQALQEVKKSEVEAFLTFLETETSKTDVAQRVLDSLRPKSRVEIPSAPSPSLVKTEETPVSQTEEALLLTTNQAKDYPLQSFSGISPPPPISVITYAPSSFINNDKDERKEFITKPVVNETTSDSAVNIHSFHQPKKEPSKRVTQTEVTNESPTHTAGTQSPLKKVITC